MDLDYIYIIIGFALIAALAYVIAAFLLPPFLGAPFVPSSRVAVESILALSRVQPGERMVDLGSGDGRIVMAFARAGAEAHGYEINPTLVLISRFNIRRHGLHKNAHIHWRSFRACDFSKFNIVTAYTLSRLMASLEKKLQTSLPVGGRVVSHAFKFPNWPAAETRDKVYLYKV